MAQTLPTSGLLTSWKEIAGFLGKGVRTVQRWEATLGLPVIRPANRRSGIVMARPSELEAWILKGRQRHGSATEQWQSDNGAARALFAESVRAFRSWRAEAMVLNHEVQVLRAEMRQEIDRLKSLHQEWLRICTPFKVENASLEGIDQDGGRKAATSMDTTNGQGRLLRN